jgi:hypothetical protein
MTNLASSSGTRTTSSSKNPSSLIASILGGVTLILGFAGIGGRSGEEEDWEERVVAYRRYDRGCRGRRDGPAMHCSACTIGARRTFFEEARVTRVIRRGAILIMGYCRLMMIRKVSQSTGNSEIRLIRGMTCHSISDDERWSYSSS